MSRLVERDARAALRILGKVATDGADAEAFARRGVRALSELVGADLTTLSMCARTRPVRRFESGDRCFALRAMPALDGDGWLLYVGEKAPAPLQAAGASDALSSREREVLDWVAAGKTDAQIAAILGISVRTVHKHLEHVYVKLGVEGRTAAVMRGGAVTRVARTSAYSVRRPLRCDSIESTW